MTIKEVALPIAGILFGFLVYEAAFVALPSAPDLSIAPDQSKSTDATVAKFNSDQSAAAGAVGTSNTHRTATITLTDEDVTVLLRRQATASGAEPEKDAIYHIGDEYVLNEWMSIPLGGTHRVPILKTYFLSAETDGLYANTTNERVGGLSFPPVVTPFVAQRISPVRILEIAVSGGRSEITVSPGTLTMTVTYGS